MYCLLEMTFSLQASKGSFVCLVRPVVRLHSCLNSHEQVTQVATSGIQGLIRMPPLCPTRHPLGVDGFLLPQLPSRRYCSKLLLLVSKGCTFLTLNPPGSHDCSQPALTPTPNPLSLVSTHQSYHTLDYNFFVQRQLIRTQ